MSTVDIEHVENQIRKPRKKRRRRVGSAVSLTVLAAGEPVVWLTGGALVLSLLMIVLLLLKVVYMGSGTFLPLPLVQVKLHDGRTFLGEVSKSEDVPLTADALLSDVRENTEPLLRNWIQEIGSLDRLPDMILQEKDHLQKERVSVARRMSAAERRWKRLASQWESKLDSVSERRAFAAVGSAAEQLEKSKTLVESLRARIDGIDEELESIKQAAAYFRKTVAANQTTSALLDAPAQFQRYGLTGLITLLAEHRGVDEIHVRNRSFRTENFELTNKHYVWLADYQVKEESHPELAAILERTENGRFYGHPIEFVEVVPVDVPEILKERTIATEFLTANQHLLTEEQRAAVATQLEALQEKVNADWNAQVKSLNTATVERVVLASRGSPIEKFELKPIEENTDWRSQVYFARVWSDRETVWQHFERHHRDVRRKYLERTQLQKHDLGHEYAKAERVRLKVRQAEIDYQVEAMPLVDQLKALDIEEKSLRAQLAEAADRAEMVQRRIEDERLVQAATTVRDTIEARIRDSLNEVKVKQSQLYRDLEQLPDAVQSIVENARRAAREAEIEADRIRAQIDQLSFETHRYQLVMQTCDDRRAPIALGAIVRAYQANNLSTSDRWRIYFSRWWEFLTDEPREANSEGGVMPAIWGTVTMTMIMSLAVVPFGVLAALYLREYAKSGPIVSAVRIAINNLAGVPSIVFGVFGLGFFCYVIGSYIDGGPKHAGLQPMAPARWYVLAALLAIVSVAAFILGMVSLSSSTSKGGWRRYASMVAFVLWIATLVLFVYVVAGNPFFHGFYEAKLPNPTWGTGGLLWSSLTLALMTLPVVIVATEESLASVPNSMREGSYGCGASKWQTIRRVVLPQSLPGIMTGMILAMARGAGEVAPLMLVGAVKLAPELPVDGSFPFIHASRSFMHLGFHIFDLGFQSQNSEAAKPMVYTTTLLLIVIITVLNFLAIQLRAYLKKRLQVGQF